MCKYLVLMDTDKIKNYIFSTNKLKSIRGASSILAELNEKEAVKSRVGSHNGVCVFAGGGQIMGKFNSDNEAQEFIRAEQAKYENCDASTTGIIEEYIDGFENVVKRAQIRLRRAKEERTYETHLLSNPFLKTCQLCGINPASKTKHEMFVCIACERKMKIGEKIRKTPEKSPIYKKFLDSVEDKEWEGAKFADDLSELGELSKPENYLGLIYADGNRMGERLFNRTSETEYQELSKAIEKGLQESVFESILKYIPKPSRKYLFSWDEVTGRDKDKFLAFIEQEYDIDWVRKAKIENVGDGKTIRVSTEKKSLSLIINDKKTNVNLKIDDVRTDEFFVKTENGRLNIYKKIIPFEFVVMGGDDLIMITPAEKAIPIALEMLEKFEGKTSDIAKKIDQEKFTLSAGIVIAHSKYPISSFTQRGHELLESAKKLNKDKWYRPEKKSEREDISTIDYLVITTPSTNTVDIIREKDLVYTKGESTYKLTQRPFTLQKALLITKTVKAIKNSGLSRSRLYSISDSLLKGKNQSISNILSLITRLKEDEKEIEQLVQKMRKETLFYQDNMLFPWNSLGGYTYDTPFSDILEIYDFIREGDANDHKNRI